MSLRQLLLHYVYNGFIFPDSDIRKLTSTDLTYLTKEQLKIARNEIYARHGHIFQTKDMQAYFLKQSWYRENPYFTGTLTMWNLIMLNLLNQENRVHEKGTVYITVPFLWLFSWTRIP